MKIQGGKIVEKVVNKQFEIIGERITFKDIPESGIMIVGKKKMWWYEVYKMTEDQEKEWKDWIDKELSEYEKISVDIPKIELLYGFTLSYKKKGELF